VNFMKPLSPHGVNQFLPKFSGGNTSPRNLAPQFLTPILTSAKNGSRDAFVRFGNTDVKTAVSVDPAVNQPLNQVEIELVEKSKLVGAVAEGIQGLPGAKSLSDLLKGWVHGEPWAEPDWQNLEKLQRGQAFIDELRAIWTQKPWVMVPGAKDLILLTQVSDRLDNLIRGNGLPPETLLKAHEKGLSQLFDQALTRHVVPETQAVNGFISLSDPNYNKYHIEPYHVGKLGSDAMLPLLESYLQTDDVTKLESVFTALFMMEQNLNPQIGIKAQKLRAQYHDKELKVHLKMLDQDPMATTALSQLAITGKTLEAVAAFARAWDATTQSLETIDPNGEKNSGDKDSPGERLRRQIRDDRGVILTYWMKLITRGVPGAIEALEPRKSEIQEALTYGKQTESVFSFMSGGEKPEVLEKALLAESLQDLPSRTPPANYDDWRGRKPWPYAKDDLGYFIPFIQMTQAMAARRVPGAKDKFDELREKMDDYLIQILKHLTNGVPVGENSYFYDDSNARSIFLTMETYSSAKVLPALQKLIDEPWHPTIKWGGSSNGSIPYSDDYTVIAKNRTLPQIQRVIAKIKDRESEDAS
jgi:hypothetical protein